MTEELKITVADNGIMLKGEDEGEIWVRVIENTHDKDGVGYNNLILNLGKMLYNIIYDVADQEGTNNIKVKIEITNMEE